MNPAFALPPLPDLPILAALPALREALAANSRVVLEAPPGAGKTTVVPLELLAAPWRNPADKILVLEPRQLAVRGAAARLAQAARRARGPHHRLPRAARQQGIEGNPRGGDYRRHSDAHDSGRPRPGRRGRRGLRRIPRAQFECRFGPSPGLGCAGRAAA
ncbi:hypothetical protein ACFQT0_06555 [Hymenobacter humi]|uniref:ATP-dependent helicase HrpB n=1 Tax=Hymenobacter humi TaxID=1411620 RepID=A0ABW2U3X2_9BACT